MNIFEYAEKQYKQKNNPYKSLLHSFGSFVLQTIENRCMLAVLDFMKQQDNMKVRIILHDGLILTKTDDLTKEVIKEIEDFVYDETDWHICLDLKGCKSEYQPAEKDYVVVYNDEGACNYLHSVYGDKIVRTGDDTAIFPIQNSTPKARMLCVFSSKRQMCIFRRRMEINHTVLPKQV